MTEELRIKEYAEAARDFLEISKGISGKEFYELLECDKKLINNIIRHAQISLKTVEKLFSFELNDSAFKKAKTDLALSIACFTQFHGTEINKSEQVERIALEYLAQNHFKFPEVVLGRENTRLKKAYTEFVPSLASEQPLPSSPNSTEKPFATALGNFVLMKKDLIQAPIHEYIGGFKKEIFESWKNGESIPTPNELERILSTSYHISTNHLSADYKLSFIYAIKNEPGFQQEKGTYEKVFTNYCQSLTNPIFEMESAKKAFKEYGKPSSVTNGRSVKGAKNAKTALTGNE